MVQSATAMLRVVETSNRRVGIVTDVLSDAHSFCVEKDKLSYRQPNNLGAWPIKKDLPPGNWQPLGRASEITEEQAKEIVDFIEMAAYGIDDHEGGYLCYERGYWYHKSALESFRSWCTLHGVKEGDIILINK